MPQCNQRPLGKHKMETWMRNGFIIAFHGIAYFIMFHRESQGISPRQEQTVVERWLCT